MYFDHDQSPAFSMKVEHGALSFSQAAHPTMTPPTLLPLVEFQNRHVWVLEKAVMRPAFEGHHFHGSERGPPEKEPGTITFAPDGVFIRAWPFGSQSTQDVNLLTGAIGASFAHPDSMWSDDWQIILINPAEEVVLCERGKPRSKTK
jgi:hypothetical protein